ncbi:MAG: hypothetical protein ACLGHC_05640 [Alphaproteobacteria bacterium]
MALSLRSQTQLSARDTAKFAVLVGLCAIFIDAAIAHGLFWENDPYWTYWITKSFLITTVFAVGTAFLGTGVVQGLVITAVHTAILEIYYEWLSPIGLPQEPEWLDDNHLWITGVPAHYLAILAGYLMALWIWRRASAAESNAPAERRQPGAGTVVVSSLLTTIVVLVLSGIITHALLLGEFPGLTYFVQHLLVGFVFLMLWSTYVGMAGAGWLVGALMLSLVWTSYGLYLGPIGLPEEVRYLGYQQLWMRAFPGDFIAALAGLFIAGRMAPVAGARALGVVAGAFALIGFVPDQAKAKPAGLHASASASGPAHRVVGDNPVDLASSERVVGSITIRVIEGGNRWSSVQNRDAVDLVADFTAADGSYRVIVDKPMPRHPLGKYTTWNGVAFHHQMHGETGIGTPKLPLMSPDISIYGWGKLYRNGELIASMTPVHAMVTTRGAMTGLMLEVDTEEKTLRGVSGGYLTIHWPKFASVAMPVEAKRQREWIGWAGLIGLALLFLFLARGEERREKRT